MYYKFRYMITDINYELYSTHYPESIFLATFILFRNREKFFYFDCSVFAATVASVNNEMFSMIEIKS